MVQIIPRTQMTFGEKIGAGLRQGADLGAEFAKLEHQSAIQQKEKQAEAARKLAQLDSLKKSDWFKNLAPFQQGIVENELMGNISAQSSKSLINAGREKESWDLIKNFGNKFNGQSSPQDETEGETSNEEWRALLGHPDSNIRDFAKGKVHELERAEDVKFRKEQADLKWANNPITAKKEDVAHKTKGYLDTIQDLRSLLPYTGSKFAPGKSFAPGIFREGKQKRAEFDTLAFSLEGFLRELSTKGALPQQTFQTLLTKLPSSELSDRANKGRIDAIEKIVRRNAPQIFEPSQDTQSEEESGDVLMINPKNGRTLMAPRDRVEEFERLGAQRL